MQREDRRRQRSCVMATSIIRGRVAAGLSPVVPNTSGIYRFISDLVTLDLRPRSVCIDSHLTELSTAIPEQISLHDWNTFKTESVRVCG